MIRLATNILKQIQFYKINLSGNDKNNLTIYRSIFLYCIIYFALTEKKIIFASQNNQSNLTYIIMLNQYETVFIATPVLSENQIKEAVKKIKKIITDNGGKIVHEENWGLRKLSYPIQKKSTGFYYLIEFQAEGALIEKLEVEYRRDERIIRYLTFRMDRYAIEYSEKKRKQKENEKKTEE